MRLVLPRLYVILDAGMLTEPAGETAQKLMNAGVKLLQYRAKNAAARELWTESRAIAEAAGVKAGLLINATRVAIVGQAVAPPLFDTMVALGQQRVVRRLREAVATFPKN